jgi:uncharacterized protein involved in outer membrane biogenesis
MNEIARPGMFDTARPVGRDPARGLLAGAVAVLATLVGLLLLAWTILYVTKGRFLKPTFERMASRSAAREVRVAGDFQLYLNPLDIKFRAEGLSIRNPGWATRPFFLTARLVDADIKSIPLLFGTRRADWLQLVGADLDLEWDAAHRRNSWTLGKPTGEPFDMPAIRRALIDRTRVRYRDPQLRLTADVKVDTVRASDNRLGDEVRFAGGGTLRALPFTVTARLRAPNVTLAGGENRLVMQARAGGTVLDVTGTLPGATELEGSRLRLAVRGPDMRQAFDFLGVAVPETRAWRMTSALTKRGREWRLTGMRGVVGDSDLAGRLTVRPGLPRLFLDADLATRSLALVDAAGWVGFDPQTVAARGTAITGTGRVLPDAPLRIESLRNFDADVRYRIARVKAESFPVSDVDMHLRLENSRLSFDPLSFELARGRMTSNIVVDARRRPVRTAYDIRLAPTPMGRLLAGFGVEEAGTSGTLTARARLTGEGDTVHKSLASADGRIAVIMPKGTLWTRNVQLAELDVGTFVWKMWQKKLKEPVEINCGLIAFTVRNGIAAADPILIDTRKNVILGRGGFSFRNEALDLAVRADGKKFSLFSGQSPVGIQGRFASPKIDPISNQLLGRAGAGLGLAVVASPLAGVLAFVDVGDAKAAACGPVLSGATAAAQRTRGGNPRDDVGRGTTAKSEDGRRSSGARREQRKKFLGIF